MKNRSLKICVLLSEPIQEKLPARPETIEIYGRSLPSLGHRLIWVNPIRELTYSLKNFGYDITVYNIRLIKSRNIICNSYYYLIHYYNKWKLLESIYKKEKFDVIHCRNNTLDILFSILFRLEYNVLISFQYSFPKTDFKFKDNKMKSWIFLIEKNLFYLALAKMDVIFTISSTMKEELIKKGIDRDRMIPIPMGVNHRIFSNKIDGKKFRENMRLKDNIVIAYIGSLDKLRKLEIILEAFKIVLKSNSNVKLLVVGDGDDRDHLEELARKMNLCKNIIFTGHLSYYEIPQILASIDICLSPISPDPIYLLSSPTKLFEYMAMGKPVIANYEIPEQKDSINESQGGILVKFNAFSFADAILKLVNSNTLRKEMGSNGLKWVCNKRTYDKLSQKIELAYYQLISRTKGEDKL